MKTQAQISAIIEELKQLYPDALCSLEYQKDYELLFSVRLAAQCTDARVNLVTPALFADYPDAKAIAQLTPEQLAEVPPGAEPTAFWGMVTECGTRRVKLPLTLGGCRIDGRLAEFTELGKLMRT